MKPMQAMVYSEVSRLGGVIMHRPGYELTRVTPEKLFEYLLDELLCPKRAASEHDTLTNLMIRCKVAVFFVANLLAEVLGGNDWKRAIKLLVPDIDKAAWDLLKQLSGAERTALMISGYHPQIGQRWVPLCNLTFTRDAFFVVGDTVFIANPKHEIRKREAAIFEVIFTLHPQCKRNRVISYRNGDWSIEGGDILVISDKVVAIGGVHRTHSRAAEQLTEELLRMGFEVVFRVQFEVDGRDKMHLDTTFTVISMTHCLVHAPVMLGHDAVKATSVLRSNTLNGKLLWERVPTFLEGLESVGCCLKPVVCGGNDPINQDREQWWDGVNTSALAPGVITLYDRCEETIHSLELNGFHVVEADKVLTLPDRPTVILLPSNELPKARGGPHCETMPWWRERL